jgi:outer membrane protein TolC
MKERPAGVWSAAIALGLALAAAAAAVGAEPVPISLARALELAAERNPEILAQRARAEAEAARAEGASKAYWPRLTLGLGWSRSNTPATVFAQNLNAGEFAQEDFAIDRLNDPEALSHLATTLAAEVPIDVFGKVKADVEARSSGQRAAGAVADEALQEIRLRVVQSYRHAALARQVTEVSERAVASARARESDFAARVAEGASLGADLLRARARRRQREAELAERRADAGIALAALLRALGAGPDVAYEPTESPAAPAPLEGDLPAWTARALQARASLRAARERSQARAWSMRAEERAGRPDLAAWGQLQDDRNEFDGGKQSGAFGVLLRWSVFDRQRGRRVAAAGAEARAAELESRAAEDQLRLEVETTFRRAEAARARHDAAAGGAEEGREALRVMQERRQAGMATLTDELEAEAAALAAELEELRAAAEAAIADAALLRAAGGL